MHLLAEPLLLYFRWTEIPTEVKAALPDGYTALILSQGSQTVNGAAVAVLGIVGMNAGCEVEPLMLACQLLRFFAGLDTAA